MAKKEYALLTTQQKNALFTDLKKGVMSASELSKKYKVSERTIHRYRADLRKNPGEITATIQQIANDLTSATVKSIMAKHLVYLDELTDLIKNDGDLENTSKNILIRENIKIMNDVLKTLGFQEVPQQETTNYFQQIAVVIQKLDLLTPEQADLLRPSLMEMMGEPIDATPSV